MAVLSPSDDPLTYEEPSSSGLMIRLQTATLRKYQSYCKTISCSFPRAVHYLRRNASVKTICLLKTSNKALGPTAVRVLITFTDAVHGHGPSGRKQRALLERMWLGVMY